MISSPELWLGQTGPEEGKVRLVRDPWIDEFIEEAAQFPHGQFDDQIDAVSLAVQMLESRRRIAYGF